jgi:hypothetical protein
MRAYTRIYAAVKHSGDNPYASYDRSDVGDSRLSAKLILAYANEGFQRFSPLGGVLLTPEGCRRDASLLLKEPRKVVLLGEPSTQTDLPNSELSVPEKELR